MPDPPHGASPGLRRTLRVAILLLALAPLLLIARPSGERGAADDTTTPARVAARPLPRPVKGFALACHRIDDLGLYLDAVDSIAALGANTLLVSTPAYQEGLGASTLSFPEDRCPRDAQLEAILRRARERGLATILMPIVLLADPGPEEWRGLIDPEDPDGWWTAYAGVIDRFVALAARAPVDCLVVGSELNALEEDLDRWARLVTRVRRGYDGTLAYSANWDRFDRVALWPLVDVLGVSAYFELARDEPDAPIDRLVAAWEAPRRALLDAARGAQRPLLLTEIGYPALPWATAHPWNYVAPPGQRADAAAQARGWSAFFAAWREPLADADAPMLGVCGYRWDPYRAGGADDLGYGVAGRPAEAIIRAGYAALPDGPG